MPPKTEPPTGAGPCDPGYSSTSGKAPCDPCPVNTYAKGYGNKECTKCPDGLVTDDVASEEPGDCHAAEKQTGLSTGTISVIGE